MGADKRALILCRGETVRARGFSAIGRKGVKGAGEHSSPLHNCVEAVGPCVPNKSLDR